MEKHQKDQGIESCVSNFSLALELFKAIAYAVMAKGGSVHHLRHAVMQKTVQQQIADLIIFAADAEVDRPLIDEECRVPVGYDMPRGKMKLEAVFSKGGVSELLYGGYKWELHPLCAKIDQTPGERIMRIRRFTEKVEVEQVITEMDGLGYRPATHLEAYAFSKIHPEQLGESRIIALGSFVSYDGSKNFAVLKFSDGKRRFNHTNWLYHKHFPEYELLFVRK